jgi:hypothetical protein
MLEKKMGFSPCDSQRYEELDFFRSPLGERVRLEPLRCEL